MKAVNNGLGEETPEKRELIELLAEQYFPDSKAKKEIRRIVVYWKSRDDVHACIPILRAHVEEIKKRLEVDYAREEKRFSSLEQRIYHVFSIAEEYRNMENYSITSDN